MSDDVQPGDQLCAGGIVLHAGRILLIRRGQPPSEGLWSVPGGRCLPGEDGATACVREVAEETGVAVRVQRLAGRVVRDAPAGGRYLIDDFVCSVVPADREDGDAADLPAARAGGDASDARWFTRADLDDVDLAPGVFAALQGWDLLPD